MKRQFLLLSAVLFLFSFSGCLQMPTKINRNKTTKSDSTAVSTYDNSDSKKRIRNKSKFANPDHCGKKHFTRLDFE